MIDPSGIRFKDLPFVAIEDRHRLPDLPYNREDPLSAIEGIETLEEGLGLLVEYTVWVHSGIKNWPTLITDAFGNGCRRFRTSQSTTTELIQSAAGRLGFNVEVILCHRPIYPWEKD